MSSPKKEYNLDQLRDYSSLFSRNQVKQWMAGDLTSINLKIGRYDEGFGSKRESYLQYLQYVYQVLLENYPNEYVYKNEFLSEWLIGQLGNGKSRVFNEFRVGGSIADLVMFNGVTRAFEIKSDLDSDRRLDTQIPQYQKIFNETYLIVPLSKELDYEKVEDGVGIITYSRKDRQQFKISREARKETQICSNTLMEVLHSSEYKSIVMMHLGFLPKMTSFTQFNVCKEVISSIEDGLLNKYFIQTIKKRKQKLFIDQGSHKALNQICLAMRLETNNRKHLFSILDSTIKIK